MLGPPDARSIDVSFVLECSRRPMVLLKVSLIDEVRSTGVPLQGPSP